MVAYILPADPPPTLGLRSKGQSLTFSEHGQFAYPIKWNHKQSSMVANILPADTPLRPWVGGSEHVPVAIQIKGIKNAATWLQLHVFLPTDHRPPPLVKNSTFSEHGHFAYQIKGDDVCNNIILPVGFKLL